MVIRSTIKPDKTGEPPRRFYLRVKGETKLANSISPIRPGVKIQSQPGLTVEFTVPLREIDGKRFQYQLGYEPYPDSRYYFEKWRNGTVPD